MWSWDHLSSKALIRVVPDRIIVWNDVQREEAERFHGIASDRVIVTGAQCFDQWFDRAPSRDRQTFSRVVGLPADRPLLLYACSALFKNSPSEAAFVLEWIAAVRRSPDARLRDAAILVRPHPQRLDEWTTDARDALACEGAVLWGSNPVETESRADYFDSMFHASAVVGLNTSALVEAAIVDRPVLTLMLPEFSDSQEGTFHFHHLLTVGGGFLNVSRSLEAHASQLLEVLAGEAVKPNRPFVERFIRPRGVGAAATPVFADAVERLARDVNARPEACPRWSWALRPVIWGLVLVGRVPYLERIYWNPVKRAEGAANARAIRHKESERRAKRWDKAGRVAHKMPQRALVSLKQAGRHALGAVGLARHSDSESS